MTQHIKWSAFRSCTAMGSIDGVHLFTVSWTIMRQDITDGVPYVLLCELPWVTREHKHKTEKSAKAQAERVLKHAMERIGFVPADEHSDCIPLEQA